MPQREWESVLMCLHGNLIAFFSRNFPPPFRRIYVPTYIHTYACSYVHMYVCCWRTFWFVIASKGWTQSTEINYKSKQLIRATLQVSTRIHTYIKAHVSPDQLKQSWSCSRFNWFARVAIYCIFNCRIGCGHIKRNHMNIRTYVCSHTFNPHNSHHTYIRTYVSVFI